MESQRPRRQVSSSRSCVTHWLKEGKPGRVRLLLIQYWWGGENSTMVYPLLEALTGEALQ